MNVFSIDEPDLEFSGARHHIDIRFGIRSHGPLDVAGPSKAQTIRLGIVGTSETAGALRGWLNKCASGIAAKPSYQPNLFPSFPGYGTESPFKAQLVTSDAMSREIGMSSIRDLAVQSDMSRVLEEAAGLLTNEIKFLAQESKVDVVVCALPFELLEALAVVPPTEDLPEENIGKDEDTRVRKGGHSFRALLKARAMRHGVPIQIVLPTTYGVRPKRGKSSRRHARKKMKDPLLQRALQDEATRAWNFHVALYYKGGGMPWRLARTTSALSSCYVGIGFYRSLDESHLLSSAAQVFNERGDGQIVRGAAATVNMEDRTPHLAHDDCAEILRRALKAFWNVHEHYPARVVVHKSSYFTEEEIRGAEAAIKELGISRLDLISIRNSRLRLFRDGAYPPLRGTAWTIDEERTVLYTRGSVPFFETYPGMYVPRALDVRLERTETNSEVLLEEILALTKLNWNSTQFDHAEPITLAAADHTGQILKHLREADGDVIQPSYRFYM